MQIKSLNAEQQCDYAETEGYNNVNVGVPCQKIVEF